MATVTDPLVAFEAHRATILAEIGGLREQRAAAVAERFRRAQDRLFLTGAAKATAEEQKLSATIAELDAEIAQREQVVTASDEMARSARIESARAKFNAESVKRDAWRSEYVGLIDKVAAAIRSVESWTARLVELEDLDRDAANAQESADRVGELGAFANGLNRPLGDAYRPRTAAATLEALAADANRSAVHLRLTPGEPTAEARELDGMYAKWAAGARENEAKARQAAKASQQ
ncbi:MAG: hypothetical protein ACYDB6_02925 [Candidatus Limnocylindrales bacterium]